MNYKKVHENSKLLCIKNSNSNGDNVLNNKNHQWNIGIRRREVDNFENWYMLERKDNKVYSECILTLTKKEEW